MWACEEDIPHMMKREDNNMTELHIAVEENRVSEVQKLVQNKTIINSQTKDNGETSLLLSCLLPVDTNIAKVLINSGADVNLCDFENCSPLMTACYSETEKVDIVELLLQSGANINLQDYFENTALHYAALKGHLQIVDLLLKSEADANLLNNYGLNPLMMALNHENENCAEKILPFTEDLNVVNCVGRSALMYALMKRCSKDIIMRLLEQGANVNINEGCIMPVSLALDYRDLTLFEYLWDLTDIDFLKEENIFGLRGFEYAILKIFSSNQNIPTKIQCFYKAMDKPGVDLNSICCLQECAEHDSEFTVLLLPYCICYNPIDILQYIIDIKKLNISILKLVKSILRLCTPSFKLRQDCIKYFKSCDVYNLDAEDKVILLELYNEVLELLSVDRLPTLQELSRDKIRKCLAPNCVSTEEYLSKLNMLQLTRTTTDIIRCKSDVNP